MNTQTVTQLIAQNFVTKENGLKWIKREIQYSPRSHRAKYVVFCIERILFLKIFLKQKRGMFFPFCSCVSFAQGYFKAGTIAFANPDASSLKRDTISAIHP